MEAGIEDEGWRQGCGLGARPGKGWHDVAAGSWPLSPLCLPRGEASSSLRGRGRLREGGIRRGRGCRAGGGGLHGAGGCTKEGRGPGAARQILSPQLGGDL